MFDLETNLIRRTRFQFRYTQHVTRNSIRFDSLKSDPHIYKILVQQQQKTALKCAIQCVYIWNKPHKRRTRTKTLFTDPPITSCYSFIYLTMKIRQMMGFLLHVCNLISMVRRWSNLKSYRRASIKEILGCIDLQNDRGKYVNNVCYIFQL